MSKARRDPDSIKTYTASNDTTININHVFAFPHLLFQTKPENKPKHKSTAIEFKFHPSNKPSPLPAKEEVSVKSSTYKQSMIEQT